MLLFCFQTMQRSPSSQILLCRASRPSRHPLHSHLRHLSSTPQVSSHIGSAPLTLPADVSLELLNYNAPAPRSPLASTAAVNANSPAAQAPSSPVGFRARTDARPSVKVTGPLGELSLNLPSFLRIDQDQKSRKAVVSVQDRKVKQQRAMWGMSGN